MSQKLKPIDYTGYLSVFDLERIGNLEEAYELLVKLSNEKCPLATIELGTRYLETNGEGVKKLTPDVEKAKALMNQGQQLLQTMAEEGDCEAMRMLGYTYLGLLGVFDKSLPLAEKWLVKSFQAGCFFAANDLCTFYQGSDIDKARFYYAEADRLGCRVVKNENLET